MMRSLFSGVSGLRNHQMFLDVIGNNIANVNTMGFKSSRVTFKDTLNQTIKGAAIPDNGKGGTNAQQVGFGTSVGSIDTMFSQGSLQSTGVSTDLAIQGDSFFVLSDGNSKYFSRGGAFSLDSVGNMVDPRTGLIVQGKMATDGTISASASVENISIPKNITSRPNPTTAVTIKGNLDSDAADGDQAISSYVVYDSLGTPITLTTAFTWDETNSEWDYTITAPAGASFVSGDTGSITFDADGKIATGSPTTVEIAPGTGAANINIALNFGTIGDTDGITGYASASSIALDSQDGFKSGILKNFSIGGDGSINGIFDNGQSQLLAIMVLANFNNPGGLVKEGDNVFSPSANSGTENVVDANLSGSTIAAGALEMSSVDLAQEFTNMIIAQRGFQANSRIITTSDEILQELVNLKR
ncbi:MAG: flagellar hook protein FlgE [Candidatus Firestonebacteria bacterium]|nr:flagellar hook protein FlgE [Candidatus Firestonebacteria bacterium]